MRDQSMAAESERWLVAVRSGLQRQEALLREPVVHDEPAPVAREAVVRAEQQRVLRRELRHDLADDTVHLAVDRGDALGERDLLAEERHLLRGLFGVVHRVQRVVAAVHDVLHAVRDREHAEEQAPIALLQHLHRQAAAVAVRELDVLEEHVDGHELVLLLVRHAAPAERLERPAVQRRRGPCRTSAARSRAARTPGAPGRCASESTYSSKGSSLTTRTRVSACALTSGERSNRTR